MSFPGVSQNWAQNARARKTEEDLGLDDRGERINTHSCDSAESFEVIFIWESRGLDLR